MKVFDSCNWAVCYTVDGTFFDDRQPKRTVIAWFGKFYQAEDFIMKCLPEENRNRFEILGRERIEID